MQRINLFIRPQSESERVGMMAPIGLLQLHPVPLKLLLCREIGQAQSRPFRAEAQQHAHKTLQPRMLAQQAPIDPRDLVILTVRIVVALLRAPEFISGQQHGRALRKQQQRDRVFHRTGAHSLHLGVGSRALHAVVAAIARRVAISVVLAVSVIVALIVGDQVIERESVVAGHIVNAALRPVPEKDARAALKPVGQSRHHARVSAHKAAHIVAKAVIPLQPAAAGKPAELMQPDGVPRLRDDFGLGKQHIIFDF